MDAVSEIKGRLNVEDVVSEYVELKRAGRNFKGLSPFTNEKTPSFIVSPEKQIWRDFSSGRGGDIISFIEAVEGVDFKGALEILARKAGIDLSQFQRGSKGNSNAKEKERLFEAVAAAVKYYQVQLTKHEKPLRYLREARGYEKQTILDFSMGYAPSGSSHLCDFLRSKGFTDAELLKTGLAVKRRGDSIDMFRERIVIPLGDTQGRPVGFTARTLSKNTEAPKYINTPATILYDKSRQLFGFAKAKEHMRKSGYVVVVEGNLDVVASHQAGIRQVVASAGTALTLDHLKSLQRFTGDIRLAFDDDRAGQEAAERTIPLAQKLGIELGFVKIPSGKDPDELIKQDVGEWLRTVESPEYMIDWLIGRVAGSVDMASAQGKRSFTTQVLAIIRQLKDSVEQEHFLRVVADRTGTSLASIQQKFEQVATENTPRKKRVNPQATQPTIDDSARHILEQHLLAIALGAPDMRGLIGDLPKDTFSEQAQQFITSTDSLQKVQPDDTYGKMLQLLFEETYQHTDASELASQQTQLQHRLIQWYTKHKKIEILQKLESADETTEKALLEQVAELEKLASKF